MLTDHELSAAIGTTAYGADGDKIGTVEHFFVDDGTGAPTWVAVSTGLFGVRHSVVPAVDARFVDGGLHLTVTRAAVRSAPSMAGEHLDPTEEAELQRHYGVAPGVGERPVAAAGSDGADVAATGGLDRTAGPGDATVAASAADDGAMTRSEEQLRVHTEQVAATRVRLVKYVVTEEVQVTVPLRREEIRLEEVPLDASEPDSGEFLVPDERHRHGHDAGRPAGVDGLPEEIVLHSERPVVTVEVVPTERVRLRTEQVTGQEQVTDRVQRERITVDEPATTQRKNV